MKTTPLKGPITALIVFLAGFAFFVFGVFRGEAAVVLQKATKICLECIGLG